MLMLTWLLQNGGEGARNPIFDMGLMFVLFILVMYFLILRPQMKQQKEMRKMLASLQKGDEVIMSCGIYGKIVGVKEKEQTVLLQVADNVKLEVARSSIGRKMDKTESK